MSRGVTPFLPSSPSGQWLWASALVITWFILNLWQFEPAFIFHGDHERDLRYATLLVQHGVWPESTPSISPTPFELGPLVYLLMAPGVAISADPIYVHAYFLLLSGLGFLLLYRCWCNRVSAAAALCALFVMLGSTFTFEMGRQLWHSSLLPLIVGGFFCSAEQYLREDKARFMAALGAVCAASAVQLHMAACVYILLGLGLITYRPRHAVTALGAGIIAASPLIITNWERLIADRAQSLTGSGALGRYEPASLSETLEFYIQNVHMLWGDDVGPLLTWPVIGLVLLGAAYGIRRRDTFAVFLVANVFVGLYVESLLLGNQRAHRYMHANIWATFGLVAYGIHPVLQRIKPWIWSPVLVGTALVIILEACISDVPRAQQRGWPNTREQSDIAAKVASAFPLSRDAMESRIHGVYFGETMGMGHYHTLQESPEEPASSPPTNHVLVAPSDLPLVLQDLQVSDTYRIDGNEREIRIVSFTPRLQDVRFSSGLDSRWRQSAVRSYGPQLHQVTATVLQSAEIILMMSQARGTRNGCAISVTQETKVVPVEVQTPRYPELRLIRFPATAGPLRIDIGPCPTPRLVDIF